MNAPTVLECELTTTYEAGPSTCDYPALIEPTILHHIASVDRVDAAAHVLPVNGNRGVCRHGEGKNDVVSLFSIYHPIQLPNMHVNSIMLFPSTWEGLSGIAFFSRHFMITLISNPFPILLSHSVRQCDCVPPTPFEPTKAFLYCTFDPFQLPPNGRPNGCSIRNGSCS